MLQRGDKASVAAMRINASNKTMVEVKHCFYTFWQQIFMLFCAALHRGCTLHLCCTVRRKKHNICTLFRLFCYKYHYPWADDLRPRSFHTSYKNPGRNSSNDIQTHSLVALVIIFVMVVPAAASATAAVGTKVSSSAAANVAYEKPSALAVAEEVAQGFMMGTRRRLTTRVFVKNETALSESIASDVYIVLTADISLSAAGSLDSKFTIDG